MDSDTLALLYFIVILLIMVNGSRAAAPKGTMFCIKTSISTPSDLEAGGQRPEARDQRLEARGMRHEAGGQISGGGRMDGRKPMTGQIWIWTPEAGGQRLEAGGQRLEARN